MDLLGTIFTVIGILLGMVLIIFILLIAINLMMRLYNKIDKYLDERE